MQTGGGSGGATVEIVHESLITSWPTLRRWLDESQEDSLFLEQLRQAARQWQAKNRDVGLLWGGDMVDELARFQRRYRGELPDVARAFSEEVFGRKARSAPAATAPAGDGRRAVGAAAGGGGGRAVRDSQLADGGGKATPPRRPRRRAKRSAVCKRS